MLRAVMPKARPYRPAAVVLVLGLVLAAAGCDDPSHARALPRAPEENPGAAHERAQWNRLYDESLRRGPRPEVSGPNAIDPVALGGAAVGAAAVGVAVGVGLSRDAGAADAAPAFRDTPTGP